MRAQSLKARFLSNHTDSVSSKTSGSSTTRRHSSFVKTKADTVLVGASGSDQEAASDGPDCTSPNSAKRTASKGFGGSAASSSQETASGEADVTSSKAAKRLLQRAKYLSLELPMGASDCSSPAIFKPAKKITAKGFGAVPAASGEEGASDRGRTGEHWRKADAAAEKEKEAAETERNFKQSLFRRKVYSLSRDSMSKTNLSEAIREGSSEPCDAKKHVLQQVGHIVRCNVKRVSAEMSICNNLWAGVVERQTTEMMRAATRRSCVDGLHFQNLLDELDAVLEHIGAQEDRHDMKKCAYLRTRVSEVHDQVRQLWQSTYMLRLKTEELKEKVESKHFDQEDVDEAREELTKVREVSAEAASQLRQQLLEYGSPPKSKDGHDKDTITKVVDLLWSLLAEERKSFEAELLSVNDLVDEQKTSDLWQAVEVQFLKLSEELYESLPFDKITTSRVPIIEECQHRAWEAHVDRVLAASMEEQFRRLAQLIEAAEAELAAREPTPEPTPPHTPEPLRSDCIQELQDVQPVEEPQPAPLATQLPPLEVQPAEPVCADVDECDLPPDKVNPASPPIPQLPAPPPKPVRRISSKSETMAGLLQRLSSKETPPCPLPPPPVPETPGCHQTLPPLVLEIDSLGQAGTVDMITNDIGSDMQQVAPSAATAEAPQQAIAPSEPLLPAFPPELVEPKLEEDCKSEPSLFGASNIFSAGKESLHMRWRQLQLQRQRVCGRTTLWHRQSNLKAARRRRHRLPEVCARMQGSSKQLAEAVDTAQCSARLPAPCAASLLLVANDLVAPCNATFCMGKSSQIGPGAHHLSPWSASCGMSRDPTKTARAWDLVS